MKFTLVGHIIILLFLSNLSYAQSQNAVKEINKVIESYNLVLIPGGNFTAGNSSLHGDHRDNSELNIRKIPSRESCDSFLLQDHEVTVREYLEFVFDVTNKEKISDISDGELYAFELKGNRIEITLVPQLSFMAKQEDKFLTEDKYLEYPIIGVSWLQANAYVHWLNSKLDKLKTREQIHKDALKFILPTSLQWEYSASLYQEDRVQSKETVRGIKYYPFEGDVMTVDGRYQANFGAITTNYGIVLKNLSDDGYASVAPIKLYNPYYGLYDMAGNVSEWTSSEMSEGESQGIIVKGGSFMSNPIFMQNGVRQIYSETTQSNEIGFRVAMEIDESLLQQLDLK